MTTTFFKKLVCARYNVVAATDESEETYWTCFGYERLTPDALHCTHKYLGSLDEEEAVAVKNIIQRYFDREPFKSFTVPFLIEDFFGEEKDTRVLKPSNTDLSLFLPQLKKKLDAFREDDFPYQPHVSTDTLKKVAQPFAYYCLCLDDKILAQW